jgi:hypothetical protein
MTELARPPETGWLPDTPIGDSLLRRSVANQADLQDHLVGAVGGRSDRTPDVALSDSGVAAAYLNQAVMLRPVLDADDAVLGHVASFYAGSVGLLLSPWPTPDLTGRGWQLVGHPMFVVRGPVGEPADAPPSEVNVQRAESAADLALVERIVIGGYPVPELDGLPASRAMGPALLASAVRHWIGYLAAPPSRRRRATRHTASSISAWPRPCRPRGDAACGRRSSRPGVPMPRIYQPSRSPATTADPASCAWASCPSPVSRSGRLPPDATAHSRHS